MKPSSEIEYRAADDSPYQRGSVAIFSDRAFWRHQAADELAGADFGILYQGPVDQLLDGSIALLGDAVLLDVPCVDASGMAALCLLDMRIVASGVRLVVSTSIGALDDVFACFDQSQPEILVDPSPAERLLAVGRSLAGTNRGRVRELSDQDRAVLLNLTEQVEAISRRLENFAQQAGVDETAGAESGLRDNRPVFRGFGEVGRDEPLVRRRPPDPRLVRRIIRQRQARSKYFAAALFADPAWDMLLDLTAAHAEHRRVSVTSLCLAAGVPATTALRWIQQMTDDGLFERVADSSDKGRVFISLSEKACDAMARYFAEIEAGAAAYAA